jgi:CHAT domain-containing protein
MTMICGLSCNRQESPQSVFERAHAAFLHGDLNRSEETADREFQRLRTSDPAWALNFRILQAESVLWRGKYQEALTLLDSSPTRPSNKRLEIETLSIRVAALARLHQFPEAERKLAQATEMCQIFTEVTCGDVMRSHGILAVQQGQIEAAKHLFEQSLDFARSHNDRFLEVTALINLGLTALEEAHYDAAIDWAEAAYQASTILGAGGEAQVAVGNLGWAYYNLGDSEKSLELSLEAEKLASQMGRVIGQLSWITNAGYVYASRGELDLAKQSYLKALGLAIGIEGKKDIYNALRALALVSVESGELEEARKYSDQALAIAQADNNRSDELYPLLVKGLIAARLHNGAEAERVFAEVERDAESNASLKWRAENGLAQLFEDESRPVDADNKYRAAIASFEGARSTLRRNDAKLPFSNNASRIYDAYVHFLVSHGKPDEALRWADYSRARTLTEGFGLLATSPSSGPPPLYPQQTAQRSGGTLLFYWMGEKQSYLWAIASQKTSLFTLPPRAEIEAAAQRYRKAVTGPQDVLLSADSDGQALYRMLIAPAQGLLKKDAKVIVIPDGSLNNLNFETLLAPDSNAGQPKLHYWIEDVTLVDASSLRMLAQTRAGKNFDVDKPKDDASMLLVGDSIAPNKSYPELPKAAAQVESVARHFPAATKKILTREQATPAAYLSSNPEHFSYIHFVAHGTASRLSPLDSAIVLSKTSPSKDDTEDNSFKLYARDIIQHPLRAELVTISACYGAGARAYSGEGLVGLSWAFLRTGAHRVVAALWEATDSSTEQLMDKFYDELDRGADPGTALRAAKLSLLHDSPFKNPFYWAPFQLYVGSSSATHN